MQNLLVDTYSVHQVLEKVYCKLVWQSSEIYQFSMIWLKDIWLFTKLYFGFKHTEMWGGKQLTNRFSITFHIPSVLQMIIGRVHH